MNVDYKIERDCIALIIDGGVKAQWLRSNEGWLGHRPDDYADNSDLWEDIRQTIVEYAEGEAAGIADAIIENTKRNDAIEHHITGFEETHDQQEINLVADLIQYLYKASRPSTRQAEATIWKPYLRLVMSRSRFRTVCRIIRQDEEIGRELQDKYGLICHDQASKWATTA